ncbi:hypothetical protein DIE23_37380 [Burkholderia sp. Bp9143]|nr:hypothetical protein DIE23_37380 [Burkholderia sp. Bp9143]
MCVNATLLLSLVRARRKMEGWRRHYNEIPHHFAWCGGTRTEVARRCGLTPTTTD